MRDNIEPKIAPEGSDNWTFFARCFEILRAKEIPHCVGGAYALKHYTGIVRDTKDLDIFIRPEDLEASLAAYEEAGYRTEIKSPAWLAKVHSDSAFVDIIFRSGNGVAVVDDRWFEKADKSELFGQTVMVNPIEEMIWSKAFTMERERFDLADIVHLIQARGRRLDWKHLVQRFGQHWRVLFSHLVLYGYAFPGERDNVPRAVLLDLAARLLAELATSAPTGRVCQGTLLSGSQYLIDTYFRGYADARFCPGITDLDPEEIKSWREVLQRESEQRFALAGIMAPS